jgi:Protein of unknown function (DUF1822)
MKITMTKQQPVNILLGHTAHSLARQFAAEQATADKGTQVYLNTLAVYAVHQYLNWMGIETDLTDGDSWNANMRSLFDVADLSIPNHGKVECCPVLPGESEFLVFPDIVDERKGYVAVQFGENLHEVQILGFMSALHVVDEAKRISVETLHPIEALLDSLTPEVAVAMPIQSDLRLINLTNWFQQTFDNGWQSLDQLLTSHQELSFARGKSYKTPDSRGEETAKGAKLLDLGLTLGSQSVMLLVAIAPDETRGFSILVQLHPSKGQHLPPQIKLVLLSESGMVMQEIQARNQDDYIQMRQFWGKTGETFRIQVSLEAVSLTEHFTL